MGPSRHQAIRTARLAVSGIDVSRPPCRRRLIQEKHGPATRQKKAEWGTLQLRGAAGVYELRSTEPANGSLHAITQPRGIYTRASLPSAEVAVLCFAVAIGICRQCCSSTTGRSVGHDHQEGR